MLSKGSGLVLGWPEGGYPAPQVRVFFRGGGREAGCWAGLGRIPCTTCGAALIWMMCVGLGGGPKGLECRQQQVLFFCGCSGLFMVSGMRSPCVEHVPETQGRPDWLGVRGTPGVPAVAAVHAFAAHFGLSQVSAP